MWVTKSGNCLSVQTILHTHTRHLVYAIYRNVRDTTFCIAREDSCLCKMSCFLIHKYAGYPSMRDIYGKPTYLRFVYYDDLEIANLGDKGMFELNYRSAKH